ncbi:MAG: hypothetical protein ACE361_16955 [Aureliella sp.]
MLVDTKTDTPTPIVQPPRSRAASARLLLRDERGQVIQQWLIRQSKCTFGSAENCDLRCDRPGIAPYHAIIVIGARQAFLRALAPQISRDGVPSNDLMFSSDQNYFEIGELRFELALQETQAPPQGNTAPQVTAPSNQERLKFTLARPFALENRTNDSLPSVAEKVSQAAQVADKDVDNSRVLAKMVQSAIEPLECQLQNVLQPLAQLQAESAAQRAILEEQRDAAGERSSNEFESQSSARQISDGPRQETASDPQLREAMEQFSARQSAAMDVIGERISDLNMQFSAIEHIIASVPSPKDETPAADVESSPILQGQSAAIQQLQEGMQSVSNAIQGLEDRQESARENDQQWRQQMHSEVEHLKSSLSDLSAKDDSEWKESVQTQVASLRESIESLAETTAQNISSLAAKTEAGFASRNAQDAAAQWQQDIEDQFQQLRSAVETASLTSTAPATPEDFSSRPTVAYQDVGEDLQGVNEFIQSPNDSADTASESNPFAEVQPSPHVNSFNDAPAEAHLFADSSPIASPEDEAPEPNEFGQQPSAQGHPTVHDFSPGSLTVGREELDDEFAEVSDKAENPFSDLDQATGAEATDTVSNFEAPAMPESIDDQPESVDEQEDLHASFSEQSAALFAEPQAGNLADTNAYEADPAPAIPPDFESVSKTPAEGDTTTADGDLTASETDAFASETFAAEEPALPSVGGNLQSGSLLEQLEQQEQIGQPIEQPPANQLEESQDLSSLTESESEPAANEPESETPSNDVPSAETFESINESEAGSSGLPSWWTENSGGPDSVQLNANDDNPTGQGDIEQTVEQEPQADEQAFSSASPLANENGANDNEAGDFSFGGASLAGESAFPAPAPTNLNEDSAPSVETPELPQPGSLAALLAHEDEQSDVGQEEKGDATADNLNDSTPAGIDLSSQLEGTSESISAAEEEATDPSEQSGFGQTDLEALSSLVNDAGSSEAQAEDTLADVSVPQEEAEQFFGLGAETPAEPVEPATPKLTLAELEQAERENEATASLNSPNLERSGPSYADDEEEDGSVEDYMKKLLARMRGVPEDEVEVPGAPEEPNAAASPAPAAQGPTKPAPGSDLDKAASLMDLVSEPNSEAETAEEEKMSFDNFTPRVSAPEQTQSLAAMRELANSSARTAIHRSTRKRHVSGLALKTSISVIGLIVGLVLLTINGLALNIGLVATVAAFLVAGIWGYDAITTLKPLMQAGLVLKPNQSQETSSAAQTQNEE